MASVRGSGTGAGRTAVCSGDDDGLTCELIPAGSSRETGPLMDVH